MYQNAFVVFDLETGGLIKKDVWIPPITEIAICVVDNDLNDVPSLEYESLITPYRDDSEYNPQALQVSNITLDLCRKEGKSREAVVKEVVNVLKKAKLGGKKPILVGHNIDTFDIPILDRLLEECGEDLSKYVEVDFTIDTKWWGRMKYPQLAGYKLSDCLTRSNIDIVNAHRSLTDTRANKDLFIQWMKCLRGEGTNTCVENEEKPFRESFKFQIKKKE